MDWSCVGSFSRRKCVECRHTERGKELRRWVSEVRRSHFPSFGELPRSDYAHPLLPRKIVAAGSMVLRRI
jgi:hypothetical protein